jgi:hypothetical protein
MPEILQKEIEHLLKNKQKLLISSKEIKIRLNIVFTCLNNIFKSFNK